MLNTKCVVWFFSTTFVWNISHSEKNSARCYRKCTSILRWNTRYILVRFKSILNFLRRFSKYTQISNFTKIRPVGVELLFHADSQADRQTDMKYQSLFAIFPTRLKTAMDHTWSYGKNLGAIWYRGVYMTVLHGDTLTHNSGRVTQICVFNTVKLGTSASSP